MLRIFLFNNYALGEKLFKMCSMCGIERKSKDTLKKDRIFKFQSEYLFVSREVTFFGLDLISIKH
jgi:hypothetical protein